MPQQRANVSDKQWEMLLHRVAVEILTLQKAGRDLNGICSSRTFQKVGTRKAKIVVDHKDGTRVVTIWL